MDSRPQETPAFNSNVNPQQEFPQPATAGPAPSRSRRGTLVLWVRDVAVSAVASILFILFLYQPVRVEGTSMMPRLENHDRLFINKFVYHFEAIDHDDVVVFHYPLDPSKSYIKRVIGLPGDRIEIIHGQVWLNGRKVRELYVPARYRDSDSMAAMIVPKDCYFVMGDHRSISSDSRAFGPVERSLIYGKAEFVYWPAKDVGVVR
jgi:signal peptidase I